jgi:nucleoside-diphosphate-sugar epimerase
MSRILITGATTPLGFELIGRLLSLETTEAILTVTRDELDTSRFGNDSRLHVERADLTRERDVRTLMKGSVRDLGIDAVVHGPLHRSALDRGRNVHAMNVESTRSLLMRLQSHPTVRRFVYRSFSEVYKLEDHLPTLIGEDHPLEFSRDAPQRVRDRVESDLSVCAIQGMIPCSIAVLRCAEVLAPKSGSQLWDYLQSAVCFRPAGYNPIVNVASVQDIASAICRALESDSQGVFNIPGADTLPLGELVKAFKKRSVPIPGPLIAPLYRLRTGLLRAEFRYDLNRARFHLNGVLDGRRAKEALGYEPQMSALGQ